MGLSGGSEPFDRVAQKCLDWSVPPEVTTDILAELIAALRDCDWDDLDVSIVKFRDSDAIQAAFRQAAPDWFVEDDEVSP